jgi:hypothetical protein
MYLERFVVRPIEDKNTYDNKVCSKFFKGTIGQQIILFDSLVHHAQNMFDDKYVKVVIEYSENTLTYTEPFPPLGTEAEFKIRLLNIDGTILNYFKNNGLDFKGYLLPYQFKLCNF